MASQKADPKAIAVARAVQDAAPADAVIVLFGSRARGDYRQRSDIDLMMLVPKRDPSDTETSAHARRIACAAAELEYGYAMQVDVLQLDHPRFRRCRRAVNHVAYDITRDGIPMTQIPFSAIDPNADDDDGYPDNWPDISERLRDAYATRFGYMRYDLADGAEKYIGRQRAGNPGAQLQSPHLGPGRILPPHP